MIAFNISLTYEDGRKEHYTGLFPNAVSAIMNGLERSNLSAKVNAAPCKR
jgi:hypothetical protein